MLNRSARTLIIAALRAADVEQLKILAVMALLEDKNPRRSEVLPALIRQAEASRLASISRFTLRKMVKAGRIKPVEVLPGLLRYRRSDIESL